jgi:hypothetical protein
VTVTVTVVEEDADEDDVPELELAPDRDDDPELEGDTVEVRVAADDADDDEDRVDAPDRLADFVATGVPVTVTVTVIYEVTVTVAVEDREEVLERVEEGEVEEVARDDGVVDALCRQPTAAGLRCALSAKPAKKYLYLRNQYCGGRWGGKGSAGGVSALSRRVPATACALNSRIRCNRRGQASGRTRRAAPREC